MVTSLDVIESLPPGLYEMKLEAKAGLEQQRWDQLEPGDYTVLYQYRTMDDIRALNPEGREEEAMFSTISKVSEMNANFYKTWMRPWVKLMATRKVGDSMGKLNSMRMQRQLFSDSFPFASYIRQQAEQVRANRTPIDDDHPLRQLERKIAGQITDSLNTFRDKRDARTVSVTRQMFGEKGLGAWIKPDVPDAEVAQKRALEELEQYRASVLSHITEGGFAEAVCRIVLAGMVSIGAFERRGLRLARLLAQLPTVSSGAASKINWVQLLKEQARITAVAPVEALNALGDMLPDAAIRERALALAAAVMMIEPTLTNPRSEIIAFLIDTLGVDPQRVIGLARKLTASLEKPEAVKPKAKAVEKVTAPSKVAKPAASKAKSVKTVKAVAAKPTAKRKVVKKPTA